jgi:phage terminase small subunit
MDGDPTHNPLVTVAEKAAGAMVHYAAEFELTPTAFTHQHRRHQRGHA